MTRNQRRAAPRLGAIAAASVLIFAACGSDEDSTDDATTEESAATTALESTSAEESGEEASETAEQADETDAVADGGVPIELAEWSISDPGALTAGPNTFAIENVGENPHALAIARGASYEDLPLKDNGAVDTDALGADFLVTTDNIAPGSSGTVDFDLEAGDYVFFCPIEFGPNSHAGAGQVLSVTVGG